MVRGEAWLGSSSCPTGEERPERPGVGGRALTPRPAGDSNPSPRRGYTPTGWKTGSSWRVGRCSPLAPGLALTPTHVAPPEDAQPGSGYTDSPNRNAHMSSGDPSEQCNPKGPTPGPCRAQESVIRSRDRTLTAATGAVGTWPAWQTPHAGRALSQADAHGTEYRHHMLRLHGVEAGGLGAVLRGAGAFRRLALIWPQTWWGLPVGWARWGMQRRKCARLHSVSTAQGSPPFCTERTAASFTGWKEAKAPGSLGHLEGAALCPRWPQKHLSSCQAAPGSPGQLV